MKSRVLGACAVACSLVAAPFVASAAPPEGNMQAECKGAASEEYGVKPIAITVGVVSRAAEGFSIEGTADLGDQGKEKFACIFDRERKLKEVVALNSDEE